MANNFDINNRTEGTETDNKENPSVKKPVDEFDDLMNVKSSKETAVLNDEEKKLSKSEMAALIAKNLSDEDENEEDDFTFIKTNDIKKAASSPAKQHDENQTKASSEKKPHKAQESKADMLQKSKEGTKRSEKAEKAYEKENKKIKKKKEKSSGGHTAGLVLVLMGGFVLIAAVAFYVGGLILTNGKFLPHTTINGKNVSMMTAAQAADVVYDKDLPEDITLLKQDGTNVKVSLAAIDYKLDTEKKVQALLDKKDTALWFVSLFNHTTYEMQAPEGEFDSEKLESELEKIDWGDSEPTDAYITSSEDGFEIVPEEPGDKLDVQKLSAYVEDHLEEGELDINIVDSGSYIPASVTAADLQDTLEKMNSVVQIEITIDFDYTQEVLSGKDFAKWLTFKEDGSYTVDRDKVMGYVEQLASKYDTYNTPRKFHATLQGDITVPISNDAKYGWWIYQDETCDLIVKLIEEGKSVTTDPIYYYTTNADGSKGYIFTGREEARSADDDIGDTYVEIDLTAQTLWHYVDGELKHTCGIVSGQLKPEERMTLPGVYKVWYKARNYTMNGENSTETWTTTCSYWTRVAIVGIGLHDSQWRGNAVGGEIYKTNGSHGCINMTLNDAKYIYEQVDYSTPVVMYY